MHVKVHTIHSSVYHKNMTTFIGDTFAHCTVWSKDSLFINSSKIKIQLSGYVISGCGLSLKNLLKGWQLWSEYYTLTLMAYGDDNHTLNLVLVTLKYCVK